MSFDLGDVATVSYTLQVDDIPTDAAVTLTVTDPTGAISVSTPRHDGVGLYSADLSVTVAGVWTYTFTATGAAQDSESGTFEVLTPTPGRITLPQARQHLQFDDDDHSEDDDLQFFVDSANEWMATAVTDITPKPVQMGTLELIRIAWKSQRGPAGGDLEGDELGGRGFLGFAIPNAVREWIEPWAVGELQGGTALGSFPESTCWPDPVGRPWVW